MNYGLTLTLAFAFGLLGLLCSGNGRSEDTKQTNAFLEKLNKPMEFRYAGNGGSCIGCEWIVAEGTIMENTPKRFREFMKGPHHGAIYFNSPGGNLFAAMQLGELIRARKFDTVVGQSFPIPNVIGSAEETKPGVCASACVYALLGGVTRFVKDGRARFKKSPNRLGIHQFYDSKSISKPLAKSATLMDRSTDQLLAGILYEYVVRMGVDGKLVTLASKVPPWKEMHWLSEDEITSLRIDNSEDIYTKLELVAVGDKGAAVETRHVSGYYSNQKEPTRFRIFCKGNDLAPYVEITFAEKKENLGNWRKAIPLVSSFVIKSGAEKSKQASKLMSTKVIDLQPTNIRVSLVWRLPPVSMPLLISATEIWADGDYPMFLVPNFGVLRFSMAGDRRLTALAFQNCV